MPRRTIYRPPPPPDLERFLSSLIELGGPIVDLHGLRVPQIRAAEIPPEAAAAVGFEATTVRGERTLRPGRNPRLRLEAAYVRRIEGLPSMAVRDFLGLHDVGELVARPLDGADMMRSRSSDRVVRRGDQEWAAMGAWPWAVYENGRVPAGWLEDDRVGHELALWHRESIRQAAQRLARDAGRLRRARLISARDVC